MTLRAKKRTATAVLFFALALAMSMSALAASNVAQQSPSSGESDVVINVDGDRHAEVGVPYLLDVTVDGIEPAEITRWLISWGDGTVTRGSESPGVVQHTYSHLSAVHVITVSITTPDGIVHSNGDLVISEYDIVGPPSLRHIDGTPVVDTFDGTDTILSSAIAAADGAVYAIDTISNTIRRYDSANQASDILVAPNTALEEPTALAFGADGHLLTIDAADASIHRIDINTGDIVTTFAGDSHLNQPSAIFVGPKGDLFVADAFDDDIERFDGTTGQHVETFAAFEAGSSPTSIAWGPDDSLLVSFSGSGEIATVSMSGDVKTFEIDVDSPEHISVGPDGALWVVDYWNDALRRFDLDDIGELDLEPFEPSLAGPRSVAFLPDVLLTVVSPGEQPPSTPVPAEPEELTAEEWRETIDEDVVVDELVFVANEGEAEPDLDFIAQADDYVAVIADNSIEVAIDDAEPEQIVTMVLEDAKKKEPSAASTDTRVAFDDVYEGIDAVYSDDDGELEYSFIIEPGAEPNDIVLDFEGDNTLRITTDGDLYIDSASGPDLLSTAPFTYQFVDGRRTIIPSEYRIRPDRSVGFTLGEYDMSRSVVIDPTLTPASNLVMVTGTGDLSNARDAERSAFVTALGYTVNVIGANDAQAVFDNAAATNDVMLLTASAGSTSAGTKAQDLDIGILTESVSIFGDLMYGGFAFDSSTTSTLDVIDNSHFITSSFSTGSTAFFTPGQLDLAWDSSSLALPAGAQVLARRTTDIESLIIADTGSTLYSANTAPNRRVLLPSYNTPTSSWTADMDTVVERAAAWGTGQEYTDPLIVNSTADIVDLTPGDGACDTGNTVGSDPECTLRAAIQESNALAGPQTIVVPSGNYTRTISGSGEDGSATGDFDINDSVTITGAGDGLVTIDAQSFDRVFELRSGTLDLSNVTVTGGNIGSLGGGIFVDAGGTVNLTNVVIDNNTGQGGGLTVEGTLVATDSTISNNTSTTDGGGIDVVGSAGSANLTNVTISGNDAAGSGGGINNDDTVVLINTTIADNTAGSGGGITNSDTATLRNTIVAGNTGGPHTDVQGTVTSSGNNLIGEDGTSIGWLGSDLLDTDPQLSALSDNGGLTQTHAIGLASPALDAGTATGAPSTDQRGTARPIDGDGDSTATHDIGSYEYAPVGDGTDLLMVTSDGGFTSGTDAAKRTLFEGWGWTVTGIDDDSSSGAFTTAAAANDVLFYTDSASQNLTTVRGLDIGIVNEAWNAWPVNLYSGSNDQGWSDETTIDIIDNSHYITSTTSTGSLTIHTAADDVNYWESNTQALPAGVTVLAESPTSTQRDTLLVAETGATLYSANTAVNRRVWFPSDAASPSVFTSAYETLLERSLDWAAGNDGLSATVTVNSTGDSGDNNVGDDFCNTGGTNSEGATECTLRAAIEQANSSALVDTIEFNIPTSDSGHSSGIWTIQPAASAYSWIGAPVTIDATTQSGYTTSPVVRLDGSSLSGAENGLGFNGSADDSRVAGLSIVSFPNDGISSGADRIVVEDNHVGVLPDGITSPGSGSENVALWDGVDSIVRNNLIGGSNGVGNIAVSGTGTSATITNNVIGTDASGTLTFGGGQGVWTDATGSVSITNNTIAHSDFQGVQVAGSASSVSILGNEIRDNALIGIDLVGAGDSGNLVTANDVGDGDGGPNGLLNVPEFTSIEETAGTLNVDFDLDVPAGDYRIEFFTNTAADPSGFGEGETLAHGTTVTHSGAGSASFSTSFAGSTGDIVSATTTEDLGAGSFGATSEFSAATTAVAGSINSLVVANDDSATVTENRTTAIDVLANDVDADGDAVTILEASDGTNGTTSVSGGVVWYTPTTSYTGADSFEYVAADAGTNVTNYWDLGGDAADSVGGDDGVLTGTTTVPGETGDALAFNESSDRVTFPDVGYGNDFTLSIDFKLDDNSGSLFQYIYSHGDVNGANSVNVFFVEASHGTDPNVLRTVVRDGDDTLDNSALDFDIASLVGDGQWHTYTVGADSIGGLTVWLDGVIQATDPTRGTGTVNPAGSLFVGVRQDLAADRWYGGSVDTVQLIDGSLSTSEASDREAQVNHATVSVTVVPCADSDVDGLCDLEEDANTDADNDPTTNPGPDTDGDLTPNYLDADDDGDGTPTSAAAEAADPNGDGDPRDALDSDHDGQPDYLDSPTTGASGIVGSEQKVSDTQGGLAATIDDGDRFGRSVAPVGDLDGDGIIDLAVGAFLDDDGGNDRGAVYIVFMNANGTVKAEQKVSDTQGDLSATLLDGDYFGIAVSGLGDIDGDGIPDLAVGAYRDDDGGSNRGAVHILFLNANGTVKAEQKISDTQGGLSAVLVNDDWFGVSVSGAGDVDGDGINDLAVGSSADDGGVDRGAVFLIFLNADGTVKAEQRISDTSGGLLAILDDQDVFGEAVAGLGDIDGDGIDDIAVGANGDDDGGANRGAVHILFLNANGTVKAEQKISDLAGGLTEALEDDDRFGAALSPAGDVDGDGTSDIAVGAHLDDDGGANRGAAYILFLNANGTVKAEQKISDLAGGLTAALDDSDLFGHGVAGIGDLDGDGAIDVAVGAHLDDDGGISRGALYVLRLAEPGPMISGTVFEDLAGDVLNDGSIGDANNPGANNVDVYLYLDDGDSNLDAGDTLIGAAPVQSDSSGSYSFTDLADGDYFVVVDSKTVPSSQDPTAVQGEIWAEQTWGPIGGYCDNGLSGFQIRTAAGPCYAGITDSISDDFSQWDDHEHRSFLTVAGSDVTNIDFGFSFNVVTTVSGGNSTDHDASNPRTVQGSLRQFIQNANAIDGANTMRHVPVSGPGLGGAWRIVVTNALPALTNPNTTIDGRAFDLTDGTTVLDGNAGFLGANAAGGVTVGVDAVPLPQVAAPELEVRGVGVTDAGFEVRADNTTIRRLAIYGFGDSGESLTDGDIEVPSGTSVGALVVEDNVIGSGATAFADPGAGNRSGGSGVAISDGTGTQSTIQNNLFGWLDELGVSLLSTNGALVDGNEIRDAGQGGNIYTDALSAEVGSTLVAFTGNLIDGAPGNGVSTWQASGTIVVSNNTITNVGTGGAQTAGVAIFGGASTIEKNVITGVAGPGVAVVGTNPPGGPYSWSASIGNLISQNTFGGNGGLAIDLTASSDTESDHEQGDGVTLTPGALASTGNSGIDAPVITAVSQSAASGTTCANCDVELYRAVAGAGDNDSGTDYGEGVEYLASTTADGSGDWAITGLSGLPIGDELSAITIDGAGNTSEFGANATISAFVVNSTEDGGDTTPGDGICDTGNLNTAGQTECTLRAAIQDANAHAGADLVNFDIPNSEAGHSAGVWTMQPGAFYGFITDQVTLDASTQPGFAGDPIIELDGSLATGATAGLSLRTNNSEIRGFIVHSFDDDGLEIDGQTGFGDNNVIAGNWVGIDSTGAPQPNLDAGVVVALGASGNTIGGTGTNDANVIGSNTTAGIQLREATSQNNVVVGNFIGVLDDGATARPNGTHGVQVHVGAANNRIGGTLATESNLIAYNASAGVLLTADAGTGNSILRNAVESNGALGIDLGNDGVTANSNVDAWLDYPTITSASAAAGSVIVDFDLDAPAGGYRIEVFTNPGGADVSGYGEGEVYEIAGTITHTGSGNESFQIVYTGSAGDDVTLTATEDLGGGNYGSTSEFSAATTVSAPGIVVNSTGDSNDQTPGNGLCDTGGTNSQGATECTLRAAIEEANALSGTDAISFSIPITEAGYSASPLAYTITPGSVYDDIVDPIVIDGTTQPGHVSNPIIQLDGSAATGATAGLVLETDDSTIRGLIVHSFDDEGLEIDASTLGGQRNTLDGNWVGIDASGAANGNTDVGVLITVGAADNTITGNVISSNGNAGLVIRNAGSDNNIVQSNIIGLAPDATTPRPNASHGIEVYDNAASNVIGGPGPTDGNIVASNSASGIVVQPNAGGANSILGNAVYSNAALGIDLGNDGVTVNSGVDAWLDYPTITSAIDAAGSVTVDFDLDVPAGDYRIEAFTNPGGADGSGYGEGETYETATTITHTGSGTESFQIAYTGSAGDDVTLTATEQAAGPAYGSTSEFSAASSVVLPGIVVNSTGDSADNNAGNGTCDTGGTVGASPECTLRAAIQEANALAGIDTINFNIPQTDSGYAASPESFAIRPTSLLPALSTPMILDASTQPEYAVNSRPVIEVDGTNVSAGEENGLYLTGGGSTVRGFVLNNWGDDAIDIEFAGGNTIVGNYVGTNVAGTAAEANAWGINVKTGGNTIGGSTAADRNVVSGNTNDGLYIYTSSATGNVVEGNYIGTNSAGSSALPNGDTGVYIHSGANGNTIGGSTPARGNVISGNGSGDAGVRIDGGTTSGNTIQHNRIGTNAAGDAPIPNNLHGLRIDGAPNTQVLDNLISGNDVHGVYVFGAAATGTQILRNSIGTNAAESATIPNVFDGVRLEGSSSGTTVGSPGNGNVIGGNDDHGVNVNSANGNTIQANHIGTNSGGSLDLGNTLSGVFTDAFGSSNNTIGGAGVADGNTIAFNGEGITFLSGSNNTILRNDTYNNAGLGIDFDDDGVTANSGADAWVNYPAITSATEAAGTVSVDFDLDVPAGDYRIEAFTNPSGADASGYGEGETYETATTITHTGSGTESFQIAYTGSAGDDVTLTATEQAAGPAYGSTSEFSAASSVNAPTTVTVNSTGDTTDQTPGDDLCDTGGTNSQGATECTLRAAIEEAQASASVDTIEFDLPATEPGHSGGVWTISPGTIYAGVTSAITLDASTQTGYTTTPVVELDGTALTSTADHGVHLGVGSDGSVIRGLAVTNFGGAGLYLQGSDGHTVAGNHLGLGADGTTAGGNRYGMYLSGSSSSTIGGTTATDRNVLSANDNHGIAVYNSIPLSLSSFDTVIIGNYVGTDSTGMLDRGNNRSGLFIVNGSSRTLVGGPGAGEGNVISASGDAGVYVGSGSMVDSVIEGNIIGVSVDETIELPNDVGVEVTWSQRTVVEDNIIGSSTSHGVVLGNADDALVVGNTIGTDSTGSTSWTISGHGVLIEGTSDLNVVGGTLSSETNVITNATLDGVSVLATAGPDNAILRNAIFGNGGLGIDLDDDGVTTNNNVDAWIDHPMITSASEAAGTVTVDFDLDLPSGDYRIETFTNPGGADPSGNGEGEVYETATTITHTGSGTESFQITYTGSLGDIVALTTTEQSAGPSYGATSEFSSTSVVVKESFVVNSTGDATDPTPGDGSCDTGATNSQGAAECTLRAAIQEANALAGADTITFDMPATEGGHTAGIWTISPGSALPDALQTTIIDATTQTGWTSTPVVELNGTGAGVGADGLRVAGDTSVIRGLAVNRFQGDGVKVLAAANDVVIESNHIGLDASGLIDRGNIGRGVDLQNGSGPTTIGGTLAIQRNVISGNGGDGIVVWNADDNVIIGNYIGTDVTGVASGLGIGNGADGIALGNGSSGNTIGQAGAGNVLSGNAQDGVEIDNPSPSNTIQGNFIGVGRDGATAVGNGRHGVVLYDGVSLTQIGGTAGEGNVISSNAQDGITIDGNSNPLTANNVIAGNFIGTDLTGLLQRGNGDDGISLFASANNTTIGGTSPALRNVIANSGDYGIDIQGAGTDSNIVSANYVGVDGAGTADFGNATDGIAIRNGAQNNVIGGATIGERNIIAGNNNDGIWITGTGTDYNTVRGNWIGYGTDSSAIPNLFHGIGIENGASNNLIGGDVTAAENRIGNSVWDGVAISGGTGAGNAVIGNEIVANGGLGIDFENDGVTGNDAGDADPGPNGLLNHPEITTAIESGGIVTITGTFDVPAGDYRFEFFTNPSGADGSGHGEGEQYVATSTLSHSGAGSQAFGAAFPGAVGDEVSVTVTEVSAGPIYSSTSEFSATVTVTGSLLVNSTGDAPDSTPGNNTCDTGSLNSEGDPECTLRAAIEEVNASALLDTIDFAIPDSDAGYQNLGAGSSYWTIQPAPSLPVLTQDDTTIDGATQDTYAAGQGFFFNAAGPSIEIDGTAASGTGLEIAASDTTVRGMVINRFATGIALTAGDNNTVVGNYVGPDVTGAVGEVGNTSDGIYIYGATNTTIGGASPADRNVISGNRQRGIWVNDWSDGAAAFSDGTLVIGNYIGTDAAGATALPYDGGGAIQQMGIALWNGPDNTFGGPGVGDGNVVSGNSWHGIYVWGAEAAGNNIQGNIVGLDAGGTTPIGNGSDNPLTRSGVAMSSAPNNLVGGINPGEGNVIAGNDAAGATVSVSATGNTFLGNIFFDNDGVGLDHGIDGPTANDPLDADAGPNDYLNHPEITSATEATGNVTVDFDLDVPAGDYRIEAFTNPSGADPSGQGEGEVYENATTITHTGSGAESFQITYAGSFGDIVALTATEEAAGPTFGSTSEFSATEQVIGILVVNSSGDAGDLSLGDGTCNTGSLNSEGATECTLRAAMEEAVSNAALDHIHFAIPTSDPGFTSASPDFWTIAPATVLPFSTDIVEIDASTQTGWSGTPIVQLDGALITDVTADGLQLGAGMTARSLSITRWLDDGVVTDQDGATIASSWFGIAPDGTPQPNGSSDVMIFGTSDGGVIGGPTPSDGNVFAAGGTNDGVSIAGDAVNALVQNNRFGVTADGLTALGTVTAELLNIVDQASSTAVVDNQFGGSPAAAIVVFTDATDVTITGNTFGTDSALSAVLSVGSAIYVDSTGTATFGGTAPADFNTVRNVTNQAINVAGTSTGTTTSLGNSMFGSGVLGIDLGSNGVTLNDDDDIDSGPNGLLNFPDITSAITSGPNARVDFGLDVPAGTYRIEAFTNPSGAHGSGYGEGETFSATSTIVHAGAGRETFDITFPGGIGDLVSLTTTEDLGGGTFGATSEFSATVQVTDPVLALTEDRSIRRSDGAVAGGISLSADAEPGLAGTAIRFDGANDRLVGPSLDVTSSSLSLAAVFNADTNVGDPRLISKRTGGGSPIAELHLDSATDEVVVSLRLSGATTTARGGLIVPGSWHAAIASWDGAELVLFVDGAEVDRVPASGTLATEVATDVTLGNTESNTAPFDGLIDEVRVQHEPTSLGSAAARTSNATVADFVSVGGEQTATAGAWTTSSVETRSGSFALSAPEAASSGAAAWAVATGVDEPGLVFESWWWFSTETGIDLSSGVRAGNAPTDQYEAALTSPSGWELRQRSGGSGSFDAPASGTPTAGTWVNVELRTDQLGDSRLFIDGVEVTTSTPQGSALLSGSMALRAGLLPTGQNWYVDDVRGRKLITPEPVATLSALDRN